MGSVWLHDMPKWFAQDPKLKVVFFPGWETRSRSTGGFIDVRALGIHHTASAPHDPKYDLNYMWVNSPVKPIGNIYLARDGVIYVGAAGAANTMGKGAPLTTSKGTIPLDMGNQYMLAIEAANNGVGEVWPDAQLEAYVRMCAVLCRNIGLNPGTDIFTHHGYCQPSCPGRKIDPAGPTPLYPSLGGVTGAKTWPQAEFRKLVLALGSTPPPPPPPPPPGLHAGAPLPVLQIGSSGAEVTKLINVLKFWKWYPAEFMNDVNNGQYGQRTATGVRNMQTALRVLVSGNYDLLTAKAYSAMLVSFENPPPPPPPPPVKMGLYYVKPNDTYWGISVTAYGTGTKYKEIQAANNNATLSPGSRIKVPGIDGVDTTVQNGEGPYSIIKRCGVSPTTEAINEFYAWNGGASRVLRPGDAVFVVK